MANMKFTLLEWITPEGMDDPAASQVLLPPTVRSVTSGGAGGTSSWDGTLGRNWQGSLLPRWDPRFTIGKWWFNQ